MTSFANPPIPSRGLKFSSLRWSGASLLSAVYAPGANLIRWIVVEGYGLVRPTEGVTRCVISVLRR